MSIRLMISIYYERVVCSSDATKKLSTKINILKSNALSSLSKDMLMYIIY